jgi:hypothetical protein
LTLQTKMEGKLIFCREAVVVSMLVMVKEVE